MSAINLIKFAANLVVAKRDGLKMAAAEIEENLAALQRERDAAHQAKDSIFARRKAAILDGAEDAVIDAIEAEENAIERTLERLDLAEPVLMQSLADARSHQRQKEFEKAKQQIRTAVKAYLTKARTALEAGQKLAELQLGFCNSFGEIRLAPKMPTLPGGAFVLDSSMLTNFEADIERFFESPPVLDPDINKSFGVPIPSGTRYRDHVYTPDPANQPTIRPRTAAKPPNNDAIFVKIGDMTGLHGDLGGLLVVKPMLHSFDFKTGDDGLVAIDMLKRFEGDPPIEPGRQRVSPEIALAALRAGMADIPQGGES